MNYPLTLFSTAAIRGGGFADNGGLAAFPGLYCEQHSTGVMPDCPCINTAWIRGTYWPVSSQRGRGEDGGTKSHIC